MERNRDWIETVRNRFRDAEEMPPAAGWERLERALHPVPRMPLWRMRLRRMAVAAAVLLFCVTAGELLLRPDSETAEELPVVASAGDLPMTGPARVGETSAAEPAELARTERISAGADAEAAAARSRIPAAPRREVPAERTLEQNGTAAAVSGESSGAVPETAAPTGERTEDAAAADSDFAGQPADASAETSSAKTPARKTPATASSAPSAARASGRTAAGQFFAGEPAGRTAPRRRTALGLFAAGGMNASGSSVGLASRSLGSLSVGSGAVDLSAPAMPDYESGSFRHRQPLGFGLSVRRGFAHGFSLETGVNYTLLRSDVHMPLAEEDFSQKLHFIGIPLRANWNFLQRKRFLLYIGAGCMVETCISAKFGSSSVDEPGAFWSVMGAVGAEYRLGGPVGLYFEPDVTYYFNDTRLHTSRTDSPATFTLRLGVRLSF